MKIKRHEQYRRMNWSGGSTTELALYPPESSYEKRDFLFRLSSASVTDRRSTFTRLNGIRRILLVLDGKLRLTHNGVENSWLEPKQQASFPGGWDTKSEGIATDFNIMLRGPAEGAVAWISLPAGAKRRFDIAGAGSHGFLFCYLVRGNIRITDQADCGELFQADLSMAEFSDGRYACAFENTGDLAAELLLTQIYIQ